MLNLSSAIAALLFYAVWRLWKATFHKSSLIQLPGPQRDSWLGGNLKQAFSDDDPDFQLKNVKKFGNVFRMHNMLGGDAVFVSDPQALYQIAVKDQHLFPETRAFITTNSIIFGHGLLSAEGEKHRKQRKMLNPVFSTTHMRGVTPLMYPIANKLRDAVAHFVDRGEQQIDMMHWISRTALELIGQAGFSYSFDDLKPTMDSHNPVTQAIKQLAPTASSPSLFFFRPLLPILDPLFPRWLLGMVVRAIPHAVLQKVVHIVDIMHSTSVKVYEDKKRALAAGDATAMEQIDTNTDIMSILMKMNNKVASPDRLSDNELLAQMNTFIFAGSDTTSSALTKTLYLLSRHPDAQTRLRKEVQDARDLHGDIDYDTLINLPYLDAVCRETLRCDPPAVRLTRETAQDVVLTLKTPVKATDGVTDIRELPLKKGTLLVIGIEAYNRNKDIWGPDADEWKPDRWLEPLPKSVTEEHSPGIFSHTMTFFGGNRACIGLKFSQLEMKIILSVLIDSFDFSPAKEDIKWLKSSLQFPIIEDQQKDITPRLPMKVSVVPRSSY